MPFSGPYLNLNGLFFVMLWESMSGYERNKKILERLLRVLLNLKYDDNGLMKDFFREYI